MDNTQTSSFDEQACKVKLQQLIKNNKGRKEPLKGDKMPFSDTWVGLVKLTGITKEAIDYFYDGFKIAGSEPLYRYASDTNVTNAYTTFTKARRSVENERECTMRAMLNLLALELIEPNTPNPLDFISRRLPSLVKSKKSSQNLKQTVRKLIVQPLAQSPINAKADMQPSSARSLLNTMGPSLESIINDNKTRKADLAAARSLFGWLEEQANATPVNEEAVEVASVSSDSSANQLAEHSSETDTEDVPNVSQTDSAPEALPTPEIPTIDSNPSESQNELSVECQEDVAATSAPEEEEEQPTTEAEPETPNTNDSTDNETISTASKPQEELDKLREKLKKEEAARQAAEKQAEMLRTLLEKAQRDISDQRAAFNGDHTKLQRRSDTLEAENASLREDLAAAEGMLTMLEERNVHQSNVADQKMVRELKFEYQDFRDALNADMTVDLGENMRDQLSNVFDILIANGINLEG